MKQQIKREITAANYKKRRGTKMFPCFYRTRVDDPILKRWALNLLLNGPPSSRTVLVLILLCFWFLKTEANAGHVTLR